MGRSLPPTSGCVRVSVEKVNNLAFSQLGQAVYYKYNGQSNLDKLTSS